jgi:hypothetical protein
MHIEIRDKDLEARVQKQIQATVAASAGEALLRLLETQEEQDRWLLENKTAINAKLKRGIDQLDRGEGIPEDQLDAYLAKLKSSPDEGSLRSCARGCARLSPDLAGISRTTSVLQWRTVLNRPFAKKLFSLRGRPAGPLAQGPDG